MKVIMTNQEVAVVTPMLLRHPRDQCFRRNAFGLCLDHDRRAVRVFGTDIDAVMPLHALKAHPDIGLYGLDEVPKMQRSVGVRQRTGNEYLAGHGQPGPANEPTIIACSAARYSWSLFSSNLALLMPFL